MAARILGLLAVTQALPDSLAVAACQLVGTLPPSMAQLAQLQHLDLTLNAFTGVIPPPWFANMTRLQDLLLVRPVQLVEMLTWIGSAAQ